VAKIDLQYDLINYTPASASPPQANFNRIEQHINQELIERGGTVGMTAQLKLVGDPVAALDAAPKQYVDQVLPVGIIMMYGGAAVPVGGRWALCNGAELDSTTNAALFAVIANNFSPAGTPAGRFHLPNLVDRFPIGAGTTALLGVSGGAKDAVVPTHSHSIDHGHAGTTSGNDSPDHWHGLGGHSHSVNINSGTESATHYHSMRGAADGSTGGGYGENNIAPRTSTGFGYVASTDGQDTNHYHGVNGNTGGPSGGSDWASARHAHTTSTPAMTGRSGTEGVAVTNANLPPYLGVTLIIRIS